MFNIGPAELIVILIVALVILGPDKLPEMARTVGKGMRELRKASEDLKDQVETEFYSVDPARPTIKPAVHAVAVESSLPPAPPPFQSPDEVAAAGTAQGAADTEPRNG